MACLLQIFKLKIEIKMFKRQRGGAKPELFCTIHIHPSSISDPPLPESYGSYHCTNANIHGHSQSVQLYATFAKISGTKFGPETHIA